MYLMVLFQPIQLLTWCSASSETFGVRRISITCPRIGYVNKMDRSNVDFFETDPRRMKDYPWESIAIRLLIGAEKTSKMLTTC